MSAAEMVQLWVAGALQVGLLGFQSRNIHAGKYAAAAVTSFGIAGAQVLFVRGVVDGDPVTVWLIYGTAGAAGIVASMWAWKRTIGRRA